VVTALLELQDDSGDAAFNRALAFARDMLPENTEGRAPIGKF
jgi:hypothetical protein